MTSQLVGTDANPDLPPDPQKFRWRETSKVVEFECGCRGHKFSEVRGPGATRFDPVIFRDDLARRAVYDFVCHRHGPGMNKYVGYGGFVDFDQWRKHRRRLFV